MPAAFNHKPPANGYAWWYIDGTSSDGRHGITLIVMLGNVFSPFYAAARRRGAAEPMNYCAMNVALYGKSGSGWALTERGASAVSQSPDRISIAANSLSWDQGVLTVDIDETAAPWPRRLHGRVRLWPDFVQPLTYPLDLAGRHRWRPWAPCASIEVDFEAPSMHWSGRGYADANTGDEALEQAFEGWHWSRAPLGNGSTAVFYETRQLGGEPASSLALCFGNDGAISTIDAPQEARLGNTRWGLARSTHCDRGAAARVAETLEDTPFYARSLISTQLLGEPVLAMHESLSMTRFRKRWVQWLLPFRMRREAR